MEWDTNSYGERIREYLTRGFLQERKIFIAGYGNKTFTLVLESTAEPHLGPSQKFVGADLPPAGTPKVLPIYLLKSSFHGIRYFSVT